MTNLDLYFRLSYHLDNSPKDISFMDLVGNPAGVTYDSLLATAPNGETHANISGIFRLASPAGIFYGGTAYSANDFSTPDIDGATDTWYKDGTLLPLSGTMPICGNYTFDYKAGLTLLGTFNGSILHGGSNQFEVTGDYTTLLGTSPSGLKVQIYSAGAPTGHEGTYDISAISFAAGSSWFNVASAPGLYAADPNDRVRVIFTQSKSYNYCYTRPTADINTAFSCIYSQYAVEDSADYKQVFLGTTITPSVSRAWSIDVPVSYSATPVTGSLNPFTIGYGTPVLGGKNLWSGDYKPSLTTSLTYILATWGAYNWIVVYDMFNTTLDSQTLVCDNCLCNLSQCITNLYTKWESYIDKNPSKAEQLQEKIIGVLYNWLQYQFAERCGQDTRIFCTAIKDIVISEDCQCDTTTTVSQEIVPVALQPVFGSSCCRITFGNALPASPTLGDTLVFNATTGSYTIWDVYWYDGSAWQFQGNLKGATGATGSAGAAGANGADGVDGSPVVFDNTLETPTQVTAGIYTLFTGMDSGTLTDLTAVGDKYVVNSHFECEDPIYSGQVKFMIDSPLTDIIYSTIGGTPVIEQSFYGLTYHIFVKATFTVIDVAAKKFHIQFEVTQTDSFFNATTSTAMAYTIQATTAAINSFVIKAFGKSDGSHWVSCNQLSVVFEKKI